MYYMTNAVENAVENAVTAVVDGGEQWNRDGGEVEITIVDGGEPALSQSGASSLNRFVHHYHLLPTQWDQT